jgi:tRNA pseudouridine38-40 synthase
VSASQRYKLTIAYRGTAYHGWQTQYANEFYKGPPPSAGRRGIPTIQETLAVAIQKVVRHPVRLVGSSRTDTGVHAKGQVAHFDSTMAQIPIRRMQQAINAKLPDDIAIRSIEPVPDTFDAIASTISKRYQYLLWNTREKPVHFSDLAWNWWRTLDVGRMQEASQLFVGTHDFASFAKTGHGRENTIRTVHSFSIAHHAPKLVFGVEGSGFLWNQVRIMVGTLVQVGMGRYEPSDIADMLASKNRNDAGHTAPPHGLFLQWIKYPTDLTTPPPGPHEQEVD